MTIYLLVTYLFFSKHISPYWLCGVLNEGMKVHFFWTQKHNAKYFLLVAKALYCQ